MAELCPRFIVKLTVCDLETNRFVANLGTTGFPQFRAENVSAKFVSTGRQHHSLKGERKGLALTPSASPLTPPTNQSLGKMGGFNVRLRLSNLHVCSVFKSTHQIWGVTKK